MNRIRRALTPRSDTPAVLFLLACFCVGLLLSGCGGRFEDIPPRTVHVIDYAKRTTNVSRGKTVGIETRYYLITKDGEIQTSHDVYEAVLAGATYCMRASESYAYALVATGGCEPIHMTEVAP